MLVATAAFGSWPAAAGVTIIFGALIQTAMGEDGGQILLMVAVAGLVVYTFPPLFSLIYGVNAGAIIVLAWTTTDILTGVAIPSLALVGVVSGLLGAGFRIARGRERQLTKLVDDMEQIRAQEIEAERERVADELHDIIAHDVTLIAMHARVLNGADGIEADNISVQAIRDSADQALADIRRVLRIVRHDQPPGAEASEIPHISIADALADAHDSLTGLGAAVTIDDVRASIPLSRSIENAIALVIREGATNIAKHSASEPRVVITLSKDEERIMVELRSSRATVRRESSRFSSGYGVDRLRERVSLLGGDLRSGAVEDEWIIHAWMPLR